MTKVFAFDTETHLIQPGLLTPKLVCVSWQWDNNGPDVYLARPGLDLLEDALKDPKVTIVGHNLSYDLGVIAAARPRLLKPIFDAFDANRFRDTKIRAELLDIAKGRSQKNSGIFVPNDQGVMVQADYSLAGLVQKYSGRDRSEEKKAPDAWRLRYSELENIPPNQWPREALQYALDDASDTMMVFKGQGGDIIDEHPQVRAAWSLHLMATWGLRSDPASVAALEAKLTAELEKATRRVRKLGFYEPRKLSKKERDSGVVPETEGVTVRVKKTKRKGVVVSEETITTSWPAMWKKSTQKWNSYITRVYAKRGESPPTTPSGQISTDSDTLMSSGSHILAVLAAGGGVGKVLDTFIPVLKQGINTPINTKFNVLVNSGRTSSAKPNLQNIPSGRKVGGVRECFVPRKGYRYCSSDYTGAELVTLAQVLTNLFGQSNMADALNEGKDLHLAVAAEILGLQGGYEEAVSLKHTPEVKKARQLAKVANFGFPGGLGAASLVDYARSGYGVIITQAEAFALKRTYLRAWPEMSKYFEYINNRVVGGGGVVEQPVSGRVRGGVTFCPACNTMFQGLAADGIKAALYEVSKECYTVPESPLYGSRPVIMIHDEIIAELPVEKHEAAGKRLSEVMCQEMRKYTPDVLITAEPQFMDRWTKG